MLHSWNIPHPLKDWTKRGVWFEKGDEPKPVMQISQQNVFSKCGKSTLNFLIIEAYLSVKHSKPNDYVVFVSCQFFPLVPEILKNRGQWKNCEE